MHKKDTLHLVEKKSSKTTQTDFTHGVKNLAAFSKEKNSQSSIIYTGDFETTNTGISFLL